MKKNEKVCQVFVKYTKVCKSNIKRGPIKEKK